MPEHPVLSGIRAGFAICAGISGAAADLKPAQLGKVLDRLAMNDEFLEVMTKQVLSDTLRDEPPTVDEWRERMASVLAQAVEH
jgi:hypothetical protein